MKSICTFLVLALGQNTQSPAPVYADIYYKDGSLIKRVVLLDPILKVATKYNVLEPTMDEVKRIDFGMHFPDGVEKTVTGAIKKLDHDDYRERDRATKALIALHRFAYPMLKKMLTTTSDTEEKYRIVLALKSIELGTPAELLDARVDDSVVTKEFSFIGRIQGSELRVNWDNSEIKAIPFYKISRVVIIGAPGSYLVEMDAAKHGSALDQWLKTEITTSKGDALLIRAEGTVDLWPTGAGQYQALPKGYNTAGKGGQYLAGALIGKIGENGKSFLIGERYDGITGAEGELYLLIVPSPWNNASTGSYRVTISTGSGR